MNGRESGVAVTLLVLAIIFGVLPSIMLDVMNPSTVALTKSLSEGYSNSAGSQPAAVSTPQVSLTK
jgi:NADH:ubiquinone oxidoreductase subunit 4 (subunit M)